MLQEFLKRETAVLHEQLEKLMYVNDIMQRSLNLQQLKNLITTNYLVHYLYEEAIANQIDDQIAKNIDLSSRNKLNALLLDLKSVGLNKNNLDFSLIDQSSLISNTSFALGALYVLEGATLGGSVILKQLQQNVNFNLSIHFHYYGVYGKELIPKWQQFLKELNALPEKEHAEALNGAKFMFNEIAKIAMKVNELN